MPDDPVLRLATREGPPAPPAPAAPDPLPVMKVSLTSEQTRAKALTIELAAVEVELRKRIADCKPVEPPAPPPTPPAVSKPPPQVATAQPAIDRGAEDQEHGVTQCTNLLKSGLVLPATASAPAPRSVVPAQPSNRPH